jgi:2-(1,2-epoxy-1,2-dihydrophenyl)acetyl-CoA isomerase
MLPAIIGPKRAAEVLYRNLTIKAEQAVAWGLASRIVTGDRIRDEALAVAQDVGIKKPGSISHVKRLLGPDLEELAMRLEAERARFVEQIGSEEARQGIVAFLEGKIR